MGQFSWLDCKDETQIISNNYETAYVLIPKEFGGGHIVERNYDGYGNFNGNDMYELVAMWNREFLSENPDFIIPNAGVKVKTYKWYEVYSNLTSTEEDIEKITEYRDIGIDIACYDENNAALPFPIKITHDSTLTYEEAGPSKDDPNQGWRVYDDDEDEEFEC